ncbi:PIR Superfamily Protein [Plasmodium ovale wallikeri]|uniref:PIR Superfamily Protein n=1 Tax=Plasmodium ovale wallikeri TaxID=864142 RepID=A0A1A9AM55_PLAOA|nr:PIR Superfamily Protein [Plasmodium ovale wallikeri]
MYEENIVNCSTFEDEFCKKIKAFSDILMNQLFSPIICADQQDIILSNDKKMAESISQNQREESSQATTISASSFGTMIRVSLLSLFLYKVTPIGSWLCPGIGNLKKHSIWEKTKRMNQYFNILNLLNRIILMETTI